MGLVLKGRKIDTLIPYPIEHEHTSPEFLKFTQNVPLAQGSLTPGPRTGMILWPVRNLAGSATGDM